MNGITILIWITLALIALIAIIAVKLHYKGDELENDEGSILPDSNSISNLFDSGKSILSNSNSNEDHSTQLNDNNSDDIDDVEEDLEEVPEEPIIYETENNNYENITYESQNQVLVDYGNTVEKFQEPIKQSQMDIMSQNNNPKNEKHELKDLFTIDELIKESKRKDSEREKEAQKTVEDDAELDELKESIAQKDTKEEPLIEEIIEEKPEEAETKEEPLIKDIIEEVETKEEPITEEKPDDINDEVIDEILKDESINDLINEVSAEDSETETIESPTVTTQDIEEVINTATQETKEEIESIAETADITDALLDNQETPMTEEIKEPTLKTPTKVDETKDYKFGADLDEDDVFGNDLDYRKDLAKLTNTIKGSKIFQDVKDKLKPEQNVDNTSDIEENFIRNVNEYEDEFAPIINETHVDYEASYEDYHNEEFDQRMREENTRRVFNMAKNSKEPEIAKSTIPSIKEKPARDNIKIKINNNDVVLKKGDEIIFNHQGETYSSQVYAINGDDISVKYRRQNIIIKPSDVKKIY